MVENPMENPDIGDLHIEAYRRVEQLLMETALDLRLPPEEARRQTQRLLEPVIPKPSSQEQTSK